MLEELKEEVLEANLELPRHHVVLIHGGTRAESTGKETSSSSNRPAYRMNT